MKSNFTTLAFVALVALTALPIQPTSSMTVDELLKGWKDWREKSLRPFSPQQQQQQQQKGAKILALLDKDRAYNDPDIVNALEKRLNSKKSTELVRKPNDPKFMSPLPSQMTPDQIKRAVEMAYASDPTYVTQTSGENAPTYDVARRISAANALISYYYVPHNLVYQFVLASPASTQYPGWVFYHREEAVPGDEFELPLIEGKTEEAAKSFRFLYIRPWLWPYVKPHPKQKAEDFVLIKKHFSRDRGENDRLAHEWYDKHRFAGDTSLESKDRTILWENLWEKMAKVF